MIQKLNVPRKKLIHKCAFVFSDDLIMNRRTLHILMFLPLVIMPIIAGTLVLAAAPTTTVADETTTSGPFDRIGIAIAAALAVGLAAASAGYAISSVGSAAISALAEKPDTFFKSFLVVVLAEALAIYGLIMAILLWLKI